MISIKDIKTELKYKSESELIEICLKLAKFSKPNKEILNYELNFLQNEVAFVNQSKLEIKELLVNIEDNYPFQIAKILRKTLKRITFLIKISKNEETAIDLLIDFAENIKLKGLLKIQNSSIELFYDRLIEKINKIIVKLHPDLQYDYEEKIYQLTI